MMDQLRNNPTLRELILGAAVYCALWEAALLIFTDRKLYHSVGLLCGFVICFILAVSMAGSIAVAVTLDEKSARAFTQRKAAIRYLLACAGIIILAVFDFGNPLTCFAGLMGLKIGAYIQPFIHRLIEKIKGVN
ncbi:MAG: ATP synthase subunit I [Lachnospiraceae bacterium]|nr:ATP synthase subunit I [Lachnospiraceae bacterium]